MSSTLFHTTSVTLQTGRWTIVGVSVGGTHTTITVQELRICFDIGILTNESANCDKVLISHGHVDHCQSFFKHYRCRRLRHMNPEPIYIIPPIMEKPVRASVRAQFNMEKGLVNIPAPSDFVNTTVVTPDVPYECDLNSHSKCKIYSYPMTHRIPAQGYSIVTETQKLRDEFLDLPGQEIKNLRENGAELFWTKRTIEIAYTGDTTIDGVLREPDLLNAKVLLIECTILDDSLGTDIQSSRKEAHKRGHVHLQDIVENWQLFNNEHIILFHLSPRYGDNAHELVAQGLEATSEEFRSKVQVLWPHRRDCADRSAPRSEAQPRE